jgi:hypothetical protein
MNSDNLNDQLLPWEDALKEKLRQFNSQDKPHDFDVLKSKLSEATSDKVIKERLQAYHTSIESPEFNRIQNRLEKHAAYKKNLLFSKVLELGFIALVLAIFLKVPSATFHPQSFNNPEILITEKSTKPLIEVNEVVNKQSSKPKPEDENFVTQHLKNPPSSTMKTKYTLSSGSFAAQKPIETANAQIEGVPVHLNRLESDDVAFEQFQSNTIAEERPPIAEHLSENALTLPFYLESGYATYTDLEKAKLQTPVFSKGNKAPLFLLDLGLGIERDLIQSPYPTQISPDRLGRLATNFSIRAGGTLRWAFFDLNSGVRYYRKDYESVYGGKNQVRAISIPLNARVKLKQTGQFQGYLCGGFMASYVIQANYSETALFNEFPDLRYRENNRKRAETGWLSNVNYESGILEGETIQGNQYYTLNMGLGIEYQLNDKLRVYLEQCYDHQLGRSAVGPGFDRFYTGSTSLGVRMNFKNQK